MMKRLMILLTVLLLGCSAACAEGFVAPAALSGEEQNMLSLMGMEFDTTILDFVMPEGARTALLTLWSLQNGAWQEQSVISLSLEETGGKGRIALRSQACFGADLYMCLWTAEGCTASADDNEPEFDLWSMNGGTEWLWEEASVALGAVQPVAMQAFFTAEEMPFFDLTCYERPEGLAGFDHAYAVTLSFSELTEEQLYDWEE